MIFTNIPLNQFKKALLLGIVSVFSVIISSPSLLAIAPYEIQAPFDEGSKWHVCQGYNNARGTHTNTSSISLDLTGGPNCDNSASGKNIRAPFSGSISWYAAQSGSLCITSQSNTRSVMLTHIDSTLIRGDKVNLGEIVGFIAQPLARQNNGVSHLHIQAWSASNCTGDDKRVPFSKEHNMKICGAPDMIFAGPNQYNTGVWGGTVFTAKLCAPDKAPEIPDAAAVYRFWSPSFQHHFYTSSYDEMKSVYDSYDSSVWTYENYVFYTPDSPNDIGQKPVYRFWSDTYKGHFYTSNEVEKSNIISTYNNSTWKYEGVAYNAYPEQDGIETRKPVYRFWSDTYKGHFYTSNDRERQEIIANYPSTTWRFEGIAFWSSN